MKKLFILLLLLCSINSLAIDNNKSKTCNCPPNQLANLVEKLIPTVVNISTTQSSASKFSRSHNQFPFFPKNGPFEEFNEMLEQFGFMHPSDDFDAPESFTNDNSQKIERPLSLGSGFIIDPKGYIITNHHVIKDADNITVKLSDEKELKAEIIGTDARTDIALLKVKHSKPLPYVNFGDSDKSRVGEKVIAIGNPFGLGGTVTSGIISARSRDIEATGSIVDNFIQTDAAINSGNSGGPMFNIKGEVIGINTAIFSTAGGGSVGIGFAVPSSTANNIAQQLKEHGTVKRGWLGVTIQNLTTEIAESLSLEKGKGALVSSIAENSPAMKANIKTGDIITKFNGAEISTTKRLSRIVSETKIGSKVPVEIIRSGKRKKIHVIIEKFDEKKFIEAKKPSNKNNDIMAKKYGIIAKLLTDKTRSKLHIPDKIKGLVVTKINKRALWPKHGISVGHVITAADQKNIRSVDELVKIIDSVRKSGRKNILLHIYMNGNTIFAPLPIK